MKFSSILLFAALIVYGSAVHAQSTGAVDPYEEYGKHLRAAQEVKPLSSDLFGDQVSLYNGSTEFNVVDIDLPGNGSLPVKLRRRLVINDRRVDPGRIAGMGDWDVDVPYIEGVFTQQDGWTVPDSNGIRSAARCSVPSLPYVSYPGWNHSDVQFASQVWDGNQVHIPGISDEEMLKNTEAKLPAVADGQVYPWITKSFYRFGCISSAIGMAGESFYALSPTGEKYTFNWTVQRVAPSLRLVVHDNSQPQFSGYDRYRIFLLATRLEDRFGNWVNYNYSNDHLVSITANDGREINLNWSGDRVTSATAGGRTWNYSYDANGYLSAVALPDAKSTWHYSVTSGSLHSLKTLVGEPPGLSHCQSDQDLPPNTGSFVYSIDAPSGAHGTFTFEYQRHTRDFVPLSCVDGNIDHAFPAAYNFFDNFSLKTKQISGAGLSPSFWTYNYGDTGGSYFTANGPYDGSVETYIPTGSCGSVCSESKVVTVNEPDDIIKYTFGTKYGDNEGRLLKTETDSPSGQVGRIVTNAYLPEDQIGIQAFPANAGLSLLPNWKNPTVGRIRPVTSTVTTQDGDTYTRLSTAFDAFAKPTQITRSNSIPGQQSVQEQISYFNDLADWLLGLVQEVDNLNTGEQQELNVYNANATLKSHARFGQTLLSYTYNAAGQLASFTDGNNHITSLSDYYRGVPRLINYPDGASQTATVDSYGDVTAVTDQAGHITSYGYDNVGRVAGVTYPSGDEVAWLPKAFSYDFINVAERGLQAGHWRRTITTGDQTRVTYFDALLRPVINDTAIGAVVQDSTMGIYDIKGHTTFGSYPSAIALSFTLTPGSAGIKGNATSYDSLGRVIQTQQDSELGPLTSSIAYVSNAQRNATDPKGNLTTTRFQVFDTPSYDLPILVHAPAGVTQAIARDLYGNPLSITQSGLYGTENDSVTKTLTYDGYHRLCRTTEPESGSVVLAYDGANNLAWSAQGVAISGSGCGQEQVPGPARTARNYDPMNRLKVLTPPAGTQGTTYGYDPVGNITSAVTQLNNVVTTTWNGTYNFRGMLTGEGLQVAGQSPWSMGYAHDAYGSISLVHYPNGENVSYAPDAMGRPTHVGSYATGITYHPNGEVESFGYGNGALYAAAQNDRQLLSNFTYAMGTELVVSEDYAYDANGNVTAVNDLTGGPRTKSFGYDALNRLTSAGANGLWGAQSYTYDALNNLRTLQTGNQVSTYNYDPLNRLANISSGGTTQTSYVYDNRGNVIGENATTLVFDLNNELTQITGLNSYLYDANGRRVQKAPSGGGSPTYYFYNSAGQYMYQYEPATAQATNFIYLGKKLIARESSLQLAAPGSLSFDANPNNGSYTVSWGAVPAAASYLLQESVNGGGWTTVYGGTATQVALSGRVGGSYTYQVEACAGSTCSAWTGSSLLGVRPVLPTITVPTGTVNGTYNISWTAVASATGYDVQERLNGGSWTTIASKTAATSISRPGTTSGSYTYQVSANNAYGTRGWVVSTTVTVDTTYGVLPSAPATLIVPSSSSTGGATLSWSASSLATRYVVEQSSNGGTSWVGIYNSSGTSTTISGLAQGAYIFHAEACNTYGCSPWRAGTNTLVVTYPPTTAPTLSAPSNNASGNYTVSWSAVSRATSYTLEEQVNGGGWTVVQTGGATSRSIVSKTNGGYGYRVQACNAGGCGPWSGVSTVQVVIPAPISINEKSYSEDYFIPARQTGSVAFVFDINGGNAWELYSAIPGSSYRLKASGSVPSSAVTVKFTWTYISVPSGYQDAGGTVTNPASSAVSISSNPTTKYQTMTATGAAPRGRTYRLTVDFYNATGANISSSTCTLTAMTESGS